jgi:hypothetical protein
MHPFPHLYNNILFPNQLGKILLFVTSYEKCDVSQRQLILKSVTLYVKIRKKYIRFNLRIRQK